MSPKKLRIWMRNFHLLASIAFALFVYSPTLQSSEMYGAIIQFALFPALGLSGIIMWQQARLRRLFSM